MDRPAARERSRRIGASVRTAPVVASLAALSAILGIVVVGAYLAGAVGALSTPYSLDYVEGFVVRLVAEPGLLYHPIERAPHLFTSYPPVYYLLSGALALLVDPLVAARAVTVAATLSLAGLIAATVRRAVPGTRSRVPAAVAAAMFLGSPLVGFWGLFARVDVLGVLLGVAALYWYHVHEGRRALVGAGMLCLLSLYTKQSMFAAPVAIAATLAMDREYRRAVGFLGGVGSVGLAGLGIMHLATAGRSTLHVLAYNVQPLAPLRFPFFVAEFAAVHAVLLVGGAVALVRTDEVPVVYRAYAVASVPVALLALKAGSHTNFFLDGLVAVAVLSGCLLAARDLPAPTTGERTVGSARRSRVVTAVLVLLVVQFGLYAGSQAVTGMPESPDPGAERAATVLADVEGPVLSEDPLLARASGHEVTYQPNLMRSVVRNGYVGGDPIADRIRRVEYGAIVLKSSVHSDAWPYRWTDAQCRAIDDNYRLAGQVGTYWIYVPEGTATSELAAIERVGDRSSATGSDPALVNTVSGDREGC